MIKRVIFLLIIGMVSVSGVEAKDTGKSGAAFLKIGVGARAAGMGEAFCALADDISAIYWNPAGLSQLTQTEVMATHLSYFQDVNSEYLAFVRPNKNKGALGVSLSMLGVDGIKRYNKTNGNMNSDFKANDMAMSLAVSRMFGQGAAIGAGLKFVKQGIDNKNTSNLVVDLGGLCHTPIHNLVVGAVVQNIGIKASDKKQGVVDDPMPFRMRFGLSYQLTNSIICMDVNMPNDGQRTTNLGIERTMPKVAGLNTMLRAGYRMGADTGKFGFGFGITGNKCLLDYAFAPYDSLGNAHRLSTSLRFGSPKPKQRMMLLETGEKKKEPLVPWIAVQRFALGMFIEEKNFPEHLKKKKDDKKKMPVLPGINVPLETAKGTATTTEAAEVKKIVDFDKAADGIDFDGGEETATAVDKSATSITDATTTTPAVISGNAAPVVGTTAIVTTVNSPQSTVNNDATTASIVGTPTGSSQAKAGDGATPASGTATSKVDTITPMNTKQTPPPAPASKEQQGTTTVAGSPQASSGDSATPNKAPPLAPEVNTTSVNVPAPPAVTINQGTDNGLKNAASTHFKFMDIAPIDDGEVMN
ncbi:MAG: PorV/PorQ family protein [Candidatus Desantisbacteria bacterium]